MLLTESRPSASSADAVSLLSSRRFFEDFFSTSLNLGPLLVESAVSACVRSSCLGLPIVACSFAPNFAILDSSRERSFSAHFLAFCSSVRFSYSTSFAAASRAATNTSSGLPSFLASSAFFNLLSALISASPFEVDIVLLFFCLLDSGSSSSDSLSLTNALLE